MDMGSTLRGLGIGLCRLFGEFFLSATPFVFSFFRSHPRSVFAAQALPLCGAAVTFFAAAKKDNQRKRLQPPVPASEALRHTPFEPSRHMRETL